MTQQTPRPAHRPIPVKLIAAQSLNGVIGNQGRIPWRLPTDMAFFKRTTSGQVVVMGRKTFESIGKPLPNRRNVVLSRSLQALCGAERGDTELGGTRFAGSAPTPGGIEVYASIPEFLDALAKTKPPEQDVFVIGGEEVYRAFLPMAEAVYLTVVEAVVAGDAYFPRIEGDWSVTLLEAHDERRAGAPAGAGGAPWYPHRIYEIRRSG